MWTKIKLIAAAGAALLVTILYALLQREKAGRAEEHADMAEASTEAVKKNLKSINEGQKREDEIRNAEINTDPDRDIFG